MHGLVAQTDLKVVLQCTQCVVWCTGCSSASCCEFLDMR